MLARKIARFFLKKKLGFSSRRKKTEQFNFDAVKSVGIVFSADTPAQVEQIRKYIEALNAKGKQVRAICFYQTKQLPPLTNLNSIIDFVLPKEVNFMGIPSASFVNGFIQNEFDLLIDINMHDLFSVEYVSTMSRAFFKVGNYSKNNESIFDVMIKIDKNKNINYFIEQIDTYLKMINKSAKRK